MAERDYTRGEGITPINDMSTRQLRKYIRERVEEAQKRIDTIKDLDDTTKAFQEQLDFVRSFGSGRGGNIKKDTSRMSQVEMREYAHAVRDLNMLDTESKYSKDIDYKENKERYQKFIEERTSDDNLNKADKAYWEQFKSPKGNALKKGYAEYKNFINFLRSIDDVMATYGYETIKDKYYDESDVEEQKYVADLLVRIYDENKGKGMTPSQLLDQFNDELEAHKEEKKAQELMAKMGSKGTRSGKKIPDNKKEIQIKTAGKMKNGRIREKQATKKL